MADRPVLHTGSLCATGSVTLWLARRPGYRSTPTHRSRANDPGAVTGSGDSRSPLDSGSGGDRGLCRVEGGFFLAFDRRDGNAAEAARVVDL